MWADFTQQAGELWRFLQQEIFSQPYSLQDLLAWLSELLGKGLGFSSLAFLLLFPLCVLCYYLLPGALRNLWLLACSYFFYWFVCVTGGAAHPQALVVLVLLTLLVWLLALGLERLPKAATTARRLLLAAGVAASLGLLAYVKYTSFFFSLLGGLSGVAAPRQPALSPVWMVGVSFYTLIAIGYLVDVYRGVAAEKSPVLCGLLLSFFPQVVSGPILRSGDFLPQLKRKHPYSQPAASAGLRRMLWGYFKKLVISENAAAIVKLVFLAPGSYNGFQLACGSLLYTVQLYADFSGYTDIALGAAGCLGFTLPENFRRPYAARSIGDFWDRWHISLSNWLQQYLYFPLGGSRRGPVRTCFNLLFVFLCSGLWHGAGLTFLVWGGLHGLANILSRLTARPRAALVSWTRLSRLPPLHRFLQRLVTFSMVSAAWVFFRTDSLQKALLFFSRLPLRFWQTLSSGAAIRRSLAGIGFFSNNGWALLAAIALMFFAEGCERKTPLATLWGRVFLPLRWAGYYLLALSILFFGVFEATPFIYGQF